VQTGYETAQALASPVLAPPHASPPYLPHSYAVVWEEPKGCMVEAVCLGRRGACPTVFRPSVPRPSPEA